jgi:BirA family biotin operon repressor/biotin-[acetyl-CoA-carboxylase] ligase
MMSKLDASVIQQLLTRRAISKLDELEVFRSIASTNTHLLSEPAPSPGRFRVAVADHQTSGRGRHDRKWLSAPGSGLCLSFAYTFAEMPEQLPALTLALGVGVVGALRQLNIDNVSLKWPNDIVALDGKLGGILTEVQSSAGDGVTVVTGIGLNVHVRESMEFGAESGWAHRAIDLHSIHPEPPARELLAGTIIEHLYATFSRFEACGFTEFTDDWRQNDWLRGREITVDAPNKQVNGVAAGVDVDGALIVDTESGPVRIISGSIVLAGVAEPAQ